MFSLTTKVVVWLEDREVLSQPPCRNFNESSRLPLYCYWATKIKFVFVWAAIQQSPELREFFRHHYFLSMVFQPAWGLWSFRVLRSNWLGHSVVVVALHYILFHRTEPGRCNQPQSTGKLTGSIVFCSTCASSTTSTLYLAVLSALDFAPVHRLEWQKQAIEVLQEYSYLIDSSSSFRVQGGPGTGHQALYSLFVSRLLIMILWNGATIVR